MFYTFIWNFCPDLIKDGYIYAGVPPLYKITEKNGKSYKYLKDNNALAEYQKLHAGEKYIVNRMKGLGEMSEEETAETLTDPATRIIRQIKIGDITAAKRAFEDMMGDSVVQRKVFLKEHGEESTYNAE